MNQYIITEEQLYDMIVCVDTYQVVREGIAREVRSHPYQNRTCPKCKEIFELMLIEQEGVKTEA